MEVILIGKITAFITTPWHVVQSIVVALDKKVDLDLVPIRGVKYINNDLLQTLVFAVNHFDFISVKKLSFENFKEKNFLLFNDRLEQVRYPLKIATFLEDKKFILGDEGIETYKKDRKIGKFFSYEEGYFMYPDILKKNFSNIKELKYLRKEYFLKVLTKFKDYLLGNLKVLRYLEGTGKKVFILLGYLKEIEKVDGNLNYLIKKIEGISQKYDKVFLKFHPREKKEKVKYLKEKVKDYVDYFINESFLSEVLPLIDNKIDFYTNFNTQVLSFKFLYDKDLYLLNANKYELVDGIWQYLNTYHV